MHYVVHGAKGMCVVVEVLCKVGGVAVMVKSTLVFFVASVELSASLAHIGLVAITYYINIVAF